MCSCGGKVAERGLRELNLFVHVCRIRCVLQLCQPPARCTAAFMALKRLFLQLACGRPYKAGSFCSEKLLYSPGSAFLMLTQCLSTKKKLSQSGTMQVSRCYRRIDAAQFYK